MSGSSFSSCWRSASVTATNGAALASTPSMHAVERPRRPMRWTQRMRGSTRAIWRIRSGVPSRESSSTKTISQPPSGSTRSISSISGRILSRSFNVGTTMESSGAANDAAARVAVDVSLGTPTWSRDSPDASILVGGVDPVEPPHHRRPGCIGATIARHADIEHLAGLVGDVLAGAVKRHVAGHRLKLRFAGLFEKIHPRERLRDVLAHHQRAVVAQDHRRLVAEIVDQALAFVEIERDPFIFVKRHVAVEQ